MNILLTNYCNRSCAYCFAKSRIEADFPRQNLSLDNFGKILEFLKRSQARHVSLLGGEPTLNPDFIQIIQRLEAERYHANIFTNALMPPPVVDFLASIGNKHINPVVNLNHPEDTPPAQWTQITDNLKRLGEKVTLGYNIYQPRPKFEFLLDVIRECKLSPNIRLGIAQPILGAKNSCLSMEDYFTLAPHIVEFAARCDQDDVRLMFDCGFILCMFDETQLGKLRYYNTSDSFSCHPAIDIGPDLDVWHCFPLSQKYVTRLEDFPDLAGIRRFYTEKFQPLRLFGNLPRCNKCKYLRRKQCSGGCLAHKMHTFHVAA